MGAENLSIDLYVDERLRRWATWSEKNLTGGLGFPSRSTLVRIMERTPRQETFSKNSLCYEDPEAEETEEAIISLSLYRPVLAKTIILRYTTPNSKIKEKLRLQNISYAAFRQYLNSAKAWIGGALMCGTKNRNLPS